MGNILNYLKEFKNIPFEKSGFKEVDNVILSQIAYLDFEGIVPGVDTDEFVTVAEAYQAFAMQNDMENIAKLKYMSEDTPHVLRLMSEGERFAKAKLSKYINQVDQLEGIQFAALHIELDDGTIYIAFRGTDDHLVAWEEDFSMSYKTVPAQKAAASYLYMMMDEETKRFRVGGHSKGGNLAVFAAMKYPEHLKERIIEVFDNDGPGFEEDVLASSEYLSIKNKITKITPAFSVVGMLFEHECRHRIVSSTGKTIAQHDPLTWEVEGCEFIYKDSLSKRSKLLAKTLGKWISGLKAEQRREFVKSLFGSLQDSGIEKMSDVAYEKRKNFFKLCDVALHISKPTKAALSALALSFITIYGKAGWNAIAMMLTRG